MYTSKWKTYLYYIIIVLRKRKLGLSIYFQQTTRGRLLHTNKFEFLSFTTTPCNQWHFAKVGIVRCHGAVDSSVSCCIADRSVSVCCGDGLTYVGRFSYCTDNGFRKHNWVMFWRIFSRQYRVTVRSSCKSCQWHWAFVTYFRACPSGSLKKCLADSLFRSLFIFSHIG